MKLTEEELKNISNAVKNAEKNTSGEIATAIIKESSTYAYFELAFAVIVGGVYFLGLILFSKPIESWLESLFWSYSSNYLLIFTGFSLFGVIGITYLITNIPVIDRLIIPKKIQKSRVQQRAMRHFIESGTCYTKDRTGILIFISEMERRVILIADKGISDIISQDRWNNIVSTVTSGIKSGNISTSIIAAVTECGQILSKEFPIAADDTDELSNDIQILEE